MGNDSNRQRRQRGERQPGERQPDRQLFVGVDIGGTKLHAVVCDGSGEIFASARKRTRSQRGFAAVMQRVAAVVRQACAAADLDLERVAAVGVGAPSPILADGTAVSAPNLGWQNVPLTRSLAAELGRPIHAANDCDAGTLGERVYGAGRDARLLCGLFVGTGLGGGIVIDGAIANGVNHQAAEVGHMVVVAGGRPCGCGRRGCLEAYASRTGMARRMVHAVRCEGRPSVLRELLLREVDEPAEALRSSALARAYASGDALAVETLHEAADFLGLGVGNLITLLGPDVVVLGGGVMEALGEQLLGRVMQAAQAGSWPPTSFEDTAIRLAALGDDAVALGAVAWARHQTTVRGSARP